MTAPIIRFSPEIEPIVRLIEDTSRDDCVALMMGKIRNGLSYRTLLAALCLAAIRTAKWHGGLHAYDHNTYVLHSINQLTIDLAPCEHLLPVFYALDSFKVMQQVYPDRIHTTEFTGSTSSPEHAVDELHSAMQEWNPEQAERAITGIVRSMSVPQVLEPLWWYAGRDWRFIGHMAILVANSIRLLDVIGWKYAEPVLRYVVEGLSGWSADDPEGPDSQSYPANVARVTDVVRHLPAGWAEYEPNEPLTKLLVGMIRDGRADEACELVVQYLVSGESTAGAIWDAVHLSAGELIMISSPLRETQQTNGDGLHAKTSSNALHYAYRMSTSPATRLMLILQAVTWMSMLREMVKGKGLITAPLDITELADVPIANDHDAVVADILATRTSASQDAGKMAFTLMRRDGDSESILSAAHRILIVKASGDPHDVKFPVAISEDISYLSSWCRPNLLAAAVFSFWGTDREDNPRLLKIGDCTF